jgi:hypothetical protein
VTVATVAPETAEVLIAKLADVAPASTVTED